MAENKKSFLLYADMYHTVKHLSDSKAGQLLKMILSYVNDEDPTTTDTVINIAFEPVKQQLKRDLRRWDDIKMKRSEAGKKGGRPKAEKANALFENQTEATEAVTATENGTVKNTNLLVNWEGLLLQFNEITGKKAIVVNEKTKRQLKARLKEGYTKENIVDAITNCKNDAYHKETALKYLTLEFISRPDKMEKYATMKNG